jgi:hypothetical protein
VPSPHLVIAFVSVAQAHDNRFGKLVPIPRKKLIRRIITCHEQSLSVVAEPASTQRNFFIIERYMKHKRMIGQHCRSLPHDLRLPADVGAGRSKQRDADHQRPQAELESRQFHPRIILRRRQPGQETSGGGSLNKRLVNAGQRKAKYNRREDRDSNPEKGTAKQQASAATENDRAYQDR